MGTRINNGISQASAHNADFGCLYPFDMVLTQCFLYRHKESVDLVLFIYNTRPSHAQAVK